MWSGLQHDGAAWWLITRWTSPCRKPLKSHITLWPSLEVTQTLFCHTQFTEAHTVAKVGNDSQINISGTLLSLRFWIWSPNSLFNVPIRLVFKLHPGNTSSLWPTLNSVCPIPPPKRKHFFQIPELIYSTLLDKHLPLFLPKIHAFPTISCRLFISDVHITYRNESKIIR